MGKQLVKTTVSNTLRQLGIAGTIALLVMACLPSTSYAASQQLLLSPSSYTPALGSEFSVPIQLNTTTAVDGVTATLAYNPKLIQYISVDATSSVFPVALPTQVGTSSVTVNRGIFSGTVNTNGQVASVKFKALAPTNYTKITLTGNTTFEGEFTNPSLGSAQVVIKGSANADTEKPIIKALKPVDGTKSATSFSLGAASWDNVRISKMEFYIDGALVKSGTASTLYHTWNVQSSSIAKGAHTVTVKAYDPSGNVGTASVTLHKM